MYPLTTFLVGCEFGASGVNAVAELLENVDWLIFSLEYIRIILIFYICYIF